MEHNCFLYFKSNNRTEDEEVNIYTVAHYEHTRDKQIITFSEQDKEFENCITTITVENDDTVCVTRTGPYQTYLCATLGKRSISEHGTPFGSFSLGIVLTSFCSSLGEEGGELEFEYRTDTDFNILNVISFKLKIIKKRRVVNVSSKQSKQSN